MRFTANSWSELGLAPTFDQRCEVVLVAMAVGAIASASVISSLVDVAAKKSDFPFVAARGITMNMTASTILTEADRALAARTDLAAKESDVPFVAAPRIIRPTSASTNLTEGQQTVAARTPTTPVPVLGSISPPTEAAPPSNPAQKSDVQSEREFRTGHRRGRRSHGVYSQRSWQRSASFGLLSPGSISSQR
jgi:hypothetical protein